MYSIDQTPTGNALVTVGTGPIVDLFDVIAALRRAGITMIRVRPAGDDHRDRAERTAVELRASGLAGVQVVRSDD